MGNNLGDFQPFHEDLAYQQIHTQPVNVELWQIQNYIIMEIDEVLSPKILCYRIL